MQIAGSVITAMVTPFDTHLEINFPMVKKLAAYLEKTGSDSLVVVGTTGESPTLSSREKQSLIETVKSAVDIPVIAGTGSYDTQTTIALSLDAQKAGADGLLLVVPYYNKPPQKALYNHFAAVAEKVTLPIILYNIPGRTGINMSNEITQSLHQDFPHISAMKDASGNLEQTTDLAIRTKAVAGPDAGEGFRIYSGDDSATLPMLCCGATGVISVASHIAGMKIKEMVRCFFKGNTERAVKLHKELFPLFKELFTTTNPILVKESLRLIGLDCGSLRPPLYEAEEYESEKLEKRLKSMGIL